MSITPNPSAGEFRIDLGTMKKTVNLTMNIYDEHGRLTTTKKLSGNISFGNDFKSGIYFAEILDNNIRINHTKIVKSK